MRQVRTNPPAGFSLIELLVVITLIIVLVSLLQPVLKSIREAARGTVCMSNLRSMGVGWSSAIEDQDGVIPYARFPASGFNWIDALDSVFPHVPNLYQAAWRGEVPQSFNACPQVSALYQPVYYAGTSTWGYTVNTAWRDPPDAVNDLHQWTDIRRPSAYPWFMDGEVYPFADGFDMTHRAPRERTAARWLTWGVGVHHNEATAANIWFADGSARTVAFADIDAHVAGGGSYAWFENR